MHKSFRIEFDLGWLSIDGMSRDRSRTLLRLLADIARSRSLREAAASARVSYRFAWGVLLEAGQVLGADLVDMQRGRAARLSPLGLKILRMDEHIRAALEGPFERLRAEAATRLDSATPRPLPRLTLFASHDLALPALAELCAPRLDLAISFRGSDDCLEALARGDCDLAGFHVADALPRAAAAAAALGKWLDPRKHALLHFVTREQGIIARPGSQIRSVNDLARPGVRFISRQSPPGAHAGHQNAPSIAGAVAEGRADAGFGLRAEAALLRLAFVPLATERYFIACAKAALRTPALRGLSDILKSAQFAARVAQLPGYDAAFAGKNAPIEAALNWVHPKIARPARRLAA